MQSKDLLLKNYIEKRLKIGQNEEVIESMEKRLEKSGFLNNDIKTLFRKVEEAKIPLETMKSLLNDFSLDYRLCVIEVLENPNDYNISRLMRAARTFDNLQKESGSLPKLVIASLNTCVSATQLFLKYILSAFAAMLSIPFKDKDNTPIHKLKEWTQESLDDIKENSKIVKEQFKKLTYNGGTAGARKLEGFFKTAKAAEKEESLYLPIYDPDYESSDSSKDSFGISHNTK